MRDGRPEGLVWRTHLSKQHVSGAVHTSRGDNGYSKDSEGLDTPACMAPRNTTLMYDVLNQTWVPAQNNVHSISRWALAPDGSVGVGMCVKPPSAGG